MEVEMSQRRGVGGVASQTLASDVDCLTHGGTRHDVPHTTRRRCPCLSLPHMYQVELREWFSIAWPVAIGMFARMTVCGVASSGVRAWCRLHSVHAMWIRCRWLT